MNNNEILDRIRLMMKYELSKTLNENIESSKTLLNEETTCPNPISYEEVRDLAELAEEAIDDIGNWTFSKSLTSSAEDSRDILKAVKSCDGKTTYDDLQGKCRPALEVLQEIYKELNKRDFVGGKGTLMDGVNYCIREDLSVESNRNCELARKILKNPSPTTTTPTPEPTKTPGTTTPGTTTPGTSTPGKNTGGGDKSNYPTPPSELKDIDGVKKFQDWLDEKYVGWHDKYSVLNKNVKRGYGRFGPRTSKWWKLLKDCYLNGKNCLPSLTGSTSGTTSGTTSASTQTTLKPIVIGGKEMPLPGEIKQEPIKYEPRLPKIDASSASESQIEGQKLFNYYNELGYIKMEGNRIKIKEKGVKRNTPKIDIPTSDVEKINEFLLSQGYRRIPKEHRDDKFVWKKII